MVAVALFVAIALASCANGDDDGGGSASGSVPGLTDDTITLGVLTDISGPIALNGKQFLAGTRLYAERLNASGGVCGRDVVLEVADHQYDVQKSVTEYNAIKDKVFGLVTSLGDSQTAALLTDFEQDDMVAAAITYGRPAIEGEARVFLPGPPYSVAAANGTSWAIEEAGLEPGDTIGIIALGGDLGDEVIEGTSLVAEEAGMEIVSSLVDPTDSDFTAAVQKAQDADAKLVMIGVPPTQLATVLSTSKARGFDPTWIGVSTDVFNPSLLDSDVAEIMESDFYVTMSVAPWSDTESAGVKGLQEQYDEVQPDVDKTTLVSVGYALFDAYAQLLEDACADGDLTRAALVEAFDRADNLETDGLIVPLDLTAAPGKAQSHINFIARPDADSADGLTRYSDDFTSSVVEDSDM